MRENEKPRPMPDRCELSLKEWVYLIWNCDVLYNGHPAGADVRHILDRIGAAYSFSVDNAFDNLEPPRHQTLSQFSLRRCRCRC
jgi:hypothetical protein